MGKLRAFLLSENPLVSVHLHTLSLKSVNLIRFIDASLLWPLQNLTFFQSQHHVEPRRKEEDHKDVPVHQGRGHLPSRTHVALHQARSAEIPHRRGSTRLPGGCPWISYWWQHDISVFLFIQTVETTVPGGDVTRNTVRNSEGHLCLFHLLLQLRSWSWQVMLPEITRRVALRRDTSFWPSPTTRSWTRSAVTREGGTHLRELEITMC